MAALPPLLYPAELDGLPGAPFSDAATGSACSRVRDLCRWHVAPVAEETVRVSSDGGRFLTLPTLRLVTVASVRDVTGPTPVTITTFRATEKGILEHTAGRWPRGVEAVEVTMTHGHDSCPEAVREWVGDLAREATRGREVQRETTGPFSAAYGEASGPSAAGRYRIPVV